MNQTDHIDEQLLLNYLLGKSDPEDQRTIEEWLIKSETNRKELDRLEVLWLETGKLIPPPVVVDTAAAWKRLSSRIDAVEKKNNPGGNRVIRMQTLGWVTGVAAAFLIALGFWWFGVFSPEEEFLVMASMEEVLTDTLPDGSLVTLNRNSSLVYPETFKTGKREVALLGEAFFQVKPNPDTPFIVQAGPAGIQVLGTSFDVRAYPDRGVEVIVSTGKVKLFHLDPQTGDSASVTLTAGMKGALPVDSGEPVVDPDYSPDDLFWMNKTLEFKQIKLSEVIEILERNYHVQIQLSGEGIASCRLTASFSGEPIELILHVISDTFGLTLDKSDGIYRLTGNECGDSTN
ncbi:MAG: FecR domain-containing protein [Bacteroidales bacterium]|nr:FecR domain-containing protein [Bacteroidales bacterium]